MIVLIVLVAVSTSVVLSTDTDTTCYNRFEYEYNVLQKLIRTRERQFELNSRGVETKHLTSDRTATSR